MSDENDPGMSILDEYLENGRGAVVAGPLTSEYIERHSGHRLWCRTCRQFERCKIEAMVAESKGGFLRITCKACNTFSDFVQYQATFVPKWFADATKKFALVRAREFLRNEVKRGTNS